MLRIVRLYTRTIDCRQGSQLDYPALFPQKMKSETNAMDVNEYFDGKVKSISLQTATLPATVGVMDIGEYEFSTSKKEVMTVVSGQLNVKLPGEIDFKPYNAGDDFTVAANETFHLKVNVQSAYLCTYE